MKKYEKKVGTSRKVLGKSRKGVGLFEKVLGKSMKNYEKV